MPMTVTRHKSGRTVKYGSQAGLPYTVFVMFEVVYRNRGVYN